MMSTQALQPPLPALAESPAESPPAAGVSAVIQVGTIETRYQRAGCGSPVILLGSHGVADPTDALLFRALGERFRVIAPERPQVVAGEPPFDTAEASVSLSTWLRDMIDGLGLERPSIVADDGFGIAALSFALTDPERMDRLVVVSRDAADPALSTNVFGDDLRQTDHPLLLLRLDPAAEAAGADPALVATVIRFLSAGADHPPHSPIALSVDVVEPPR